MPAAFAALSGAGSELSTLLWIRQPGLFQMS